MSSDILDVFSFLGPVKVYPFQHFCIPVSLILRLDDKCVCVEGIILTKMDGDARGGAALSILEVTGKPIKFMGTGEKIEDFEERLKKTASELSYFSQSHNLLNSGGTLVVSFTFAPLAHFEWLHYPMSNTREFPI